MDCNARVVLNIVHRLTCGSIYGNTIVLFQKRIYVGLIERLGTTSNGQPARSSVGAHHDRAAFTTTSSRLTLLLSLLTFLLTLVLGNGYFTLVYSPSVS